MLLGFNWLVCMHSPFSLNLNLLFCSSWSHRLTLSYFVFNSAKIHVKYYSLAVCNQKPDIINVDEAFTFILDYYNLTLLIA